MNILILNWKDIKNPDVGGAEIILYELAKRLIKDGHKVTWFCREFSGCQKQEKIAGIKIVRSGNKFTVYWQAYQYYRQLKVKPDKVLDCINTVCWQTPLFIPKEKRIAYVNQLVKEVSFYNLPKPISYLTYLGEQWEYKTYKQTRFICYSNSVKEDLVSFGIPRKNIATFSLGIDHTRYLPGKKANAPLFVFVARLVRMKRADLCVKAMKTVVSKYPAAKLAIIGYGPEEKNINKLIRQERLENNVYIVNKDNIFFEYNKKDVKVKLLQHAWALLLPSVKEGWGMVVTEAAACGTPSIVSNVSGLMDSVVDGKTGIVLSTSPTTIELASVMIQIIEDKNLRNKLSQGALNWSKNFSWEKSYQEFLKIIT